MTAAQTRYRDTPGFKTGGASRQAAHGVASKAASQRALVLRHLRKHGPSSPSDVTDAVHGSVRDLAWGNALRSIRSRLSETPGIERMDDTVDSPTGGMQHLYRLSGELGGSSYEGEITELREDIARYREAQRDAKRKAADCREKGWSSAAEECVAQGESAKRHENDALIRLEVLGVDL